MKHLFLSAAAAMLLLISHPLLAQDADAKDAYEKSKEDSKIDDSIKDEVDKSLKEANEQLQSLDELSEYDEIIIKRKDAGKDGKVVIEIKGDKVTVNGKPIEEFDDKDLAVLKRPGFRYNFKQSRSPFSSETFNFNGQDFFEGGEDRAFLGVATDKTDDGARVIKVSEKSAAEKAGLKKDDIITKVNGIPITDPEKLSSVIGSFKPEEKITVTYKRDGKENKTSFNLGKRKRMDMRAPMPYPRAYAIPPNAPIPPIPPMEFNFRDGNMDQLFRSKVRLGIKAQDTEDGKGVKVLGVDPGSAAEKAGIKTDDIITNFEGHDVNSADELADASREATDKTSLKLKLNRNGKSQSIEVKIPKKLKTANL